MAPSYSNKVRQQVIIMTLQEELESIHFELEQDAATAGLNFAEGGLPGSEKEAKGKGGQRLEKHTFSRDLVIFCVEE